jgi:hypothetical protein
MSLLPDDGAIVGATAAVHKRDGCRDAFEVEIVDYH